MIDQSNLSGISLDNPFIALCSARRLVIAWLRFSHEHSNAPFFVLVERPDKDSILKTCQAWRVALTRLRNEVRGKGSMLQPFQLSISRTKHPQILTLTKKMCQLTLDAIDLLGDIQNIEV